MNTEQRIALELESNRKATQCDVYAAAIAQARDPHLPVEQRNWVWWSRARKQRR